MKATTWSKRRSQRYPGLIVPFATLDIDQTDPTMIDDYADRGFRGLKIINPRRNYDDPAYFPLYAVAERRKLVTLFHTGISGGMIDYLQYPPQTLSQGEELSREFEGHRRWTPEAEADSWYGAGRMQPIFLDSISVAFPDLRIIGAHLGYGLYDSAAAVARWRRNVYFDISGGTVVRRHLMERRMLRSEVSTMKLTWGSDCDMAHMSRELTAWMEAFAEAGLSAARAGPDLLGHRRAHFRRGQLARPGGRHDPARRYARSARGARGPDPDRRTLCSRNTHRRPLWLAAALERYP